MNNTAQTQPPAAGQAAHTPTPWHIETTLSVIVQGHEPTELVSVEADGYFCGGGVALVRKDANAAFIVRACNEYDDLLAWKDAAILRCDKLHTQNAALVAALESFVACELMGDAALYLDQARAALAQAKE